MKAFKAVCVLLLVVGAFLWGMVFASYSHPSLGGTVYKPPRR